MTWSIWPFSEVKIAAPEGCRPKECCQRRHSCWLQISRGVKGAGMRTQSCQSKGNTWTGAKATYASAPHWCHRQGFGLSFQHILFKEQDCWGDTGSVWKSGARVSSSTVESLIRRHLQCDLIVGLIMFQYLFQSLGWHHQVCRSPQTRWELTICGGSVWQGTQLPQSKGRVLLLGCNNPMQHTMWWVVWLGDSSVEKDLLFLGLTGCM